MIHLAGRRERKEEERMSERQRDSEKGSEGEVRVRKREERRDGFAFVSLSSSYMGGHSTNDKDA
jgi:hypothetical protein